MLPPRQEPLRPARVLSAWGVAGLHAIATARPGWARVTSAYTERGRKIPGLSLGGGALVIADRGKISRRMRAATARLKGEEFYRKSANGLACGGGGNDVVGHGGGDSRKSSPCCPKKWLRECCRSSVIVDLAAERGGNCELTRAGESGVEHGVHHHRRVQSGEHVPYTRARCTRNLKRVLLICEGGQSSI